MKLFTRLIILKMQIKDTKMRADDGDGARRWLYGGGATLINNPQRW